MRDRPAQLPAKHDRQFEALLLAVVLLFLIMLTRLWHLQVVKGPEFRLKSIGNIIRSVPTPNLRGDILDRAGRPLAVNRNNFKLVYTPPGNVSLYLPSEAERARAKAVGRTYHYLCGAYALKSVRTAADLLGLPYTELMQRIDSAVRADPGVQQVVAYETPHGPDTTRAARIAELYDANARRLELYGFELESFPGRVSLLFSVPGNVSDYLPSAALSARYAEQGLDYPYFNPTKSETDGGAPLPPLRIPELAALAGYLKLPYSELMQRLDQQRVVWGTGQPLMLADALTFQQVVYLEENRDDFPGVLIDRYGFSREYPLGEATTHLLGYTGYLINDDKLRNRLPYPWTDTVGKEGAEMAFEDLLHGQSGKRNMEVNKQGIFENWVSQDAPIRGADLFLTIDSRLQQKAFALLGGDRGAIVVTSIAPGREGEVLALVSSPSYDPRRFKDKKYYDWINDKDGRSGRPLLNRAFGLSFPPGSTFKTVLMAAGLETGTITESSAWACSGVKLLGSGKFAPKQPFHCWDRSGHGTLNLTMALANSCDVAFYNIGLGLDDPPRTIKRYAELFGYGELTGIELPGEVKGVVPDKQWKRSHFSGPRFNEVDQLWFDGNTANYSIGQGYLEATPLQVLCAINQTALDGRRYRPHLLKARRIERQVTPFESQEPDVLELQPDTFRIIKQGMRAAVTVGTCEMLNLPGLKVCAKSGTAETHKKVSHSWIVGYYPQDSPKYSFVAFVEHGGSSHDTAIPIMRDLLKYLAKIDPLADEAEAAGSS